MRRVLATVLLVCLSVGSSGAALADEAGGRDPRIFRPSSHPFGMSYAEWLAAYQIWLNEIPTPQNPLVDPNSPRNCEVDGPVVFLGPSGADCRVPEGKALVLGGGILGVFDRRGPRYDLRSSASMRDRELREGPRARRPLIHTPHRREAGIAPTPMDLPDPGGDHHVPR